MALQQTSPSSGQASAALLIGAATGWGGRNPGPEEGPLFLKKWGLTEQLKGGGVELPWGDILMPVKRASEADVQHRDETFPYILDLSRRLADYVAATAAAGTLPVVVGGDHSCALGTWAGLVSALGAEGQFGLLWIDAHMDAHTPETADEGKWGGFYHGMPVAHLLGHGVKELRTIGSDQPKLVPATTVLYGIRSYEPGEADLLARLGVRIYFMDEINQRGVAATLQEALAIVSAAPAGFGVSVDLDAFDPAEAPAVSTREKDGLKAAQTLPILAAAGAHSGFKGLEIAEFNPARDDDNHTARLVVELIRHILTARTNQQRRAS